MEPVHLMNMNKNTTINKAPDDCLLRIFSYLNIRDLESVVPRVCNRWDALAPSVRLRTVTIKENISEFTLNHLIKKHVAPNKCIETLIIDSSVLGLITHFSTRLTSLTRVSFGSFSSNQIIPLTMLISMSRNLVSFSITFDLMLDIVVDSLITSLHESCPKLQKLIIHDAAVSLDAALLLPSFPNITKMTIYVDIRNVGLLIRNK